MKKILSCKCGGRPRLSRLKYGIFKFAQVKCRCGQKTWGEYMWLSDEEREKCITEWNELQQSQEAE